jgi:hypothetical protein
MHRFSRRPAGYIAAAVLGVAGVGGLSTALAAQDEPASQGQSQDQPVQGQGQSQGQSQGAAQGESAAQTADQGQGQGQGENTGENTGDTTGETTDVAPAQAIESVDTTAHFGG